MDSMNWPRCIRCLEAATSPLELALNYIRKALAVAFGAFGALSIALGTFMAIGWAAAAVLTCADSAALRHKAEKQLTAEELKTLHPADGPCSDVYVFKRDGKNQCLMLDSVSLGCG